MHMQGKFILFLRRVLRKVINQFMARQKFLHPSESPYKPFQRPCNQGFQTSLPAQAFEPAMFVPKRQRKPCKSSDNAMQYGNSYKRTSQSS